MTPSGDEQVDPAGSETGNVVAGGQGNQVLSNFSAQGDVVLGDKVAGDIFSGDKVQGDKHFHLPAPQRPSLPLGQTPHNLPTSGRTAVGTPGQGFVGREVQLQKLSERMEPPGARVFLTGMGGIGKSELALQYAYAAMERYRAGILRLDARQGFEWMALEVISFVQGKFPGLIPDEGETKDLLPQCWSLWPATTNPPEPVLLILDDQVGNAEGYWAEEQLCLGLPQRFHRLITQREGAPTGSVHIDLAVLDPEPGLQLLQIQSGDDGKLRVDAERKAADDLCVEVGFLPLALVLLGARLAELPDLTLQQLLERLKAKGAAATVLQKAHPELRASHGVIETMLVSFEPLPKEAKELAILLAVMAPAVIPWKLVERCWGTDADQNETSDLLDAQAVLLRSNLLERQQPGLYNLHPLVWQFLQLQRNALPEHEERWSRRLASELASIAKHIREFIDLAELVEVEPFVPHISFMAKHAEELLSDEDLVWTFVGLGRFYDGQARYSNSLPYYEKLLRHWRRRHEEDDEFTAAFHNNVGQAMKELGDYSNAMLHFKRALGIAVKQNGCVHHTTAFYINNLAGSHDACRPDIAVRLYRRAIRIFADCSCQNDLHAVMARSNLAATLTNCTEERSHVEAMGLLDACLPVLEDKVGPESPLVATVLSNIGCLHTKKDSHHVALVCHVRSFMIRSKKLGFRHPRTIESIISILTALCNNRENMKAKLFCETMLNIY